MIITCTNILIHSRLLFNRIEVYFMLLNSSQYYDKKRSSEMKEIPNGEESQKIDDPKEFLQNQSS